ncbi:MAG: translation initiation factor IF-2 [Caldisericum sp. CG2_30_36_11]|nr:translation initiation factor IF-2 [Caldisericota bacterium]OIP12541.1 MAG: translation initiation factor IF-2 [Caldisericum sp. CG2_30_36_11]PIP49675.1 MAG: translation initiation factor IF-2 [Caldiserica bacterium CG23_combo_of_CG06-09_8_20_14_all_35_60]PIX28334.1 MAG: translation initiation factor IF-2 [Caldiserica bacterium CG_4_8_14_3_um_filter_35_18]
MKKDSKIRVYEIAKSLGVKSQKLIEIMEELGIRGKGTLSIIDNETAVMMQDYVKELKQKHEEEESKTLRITGGITIKTFSHEFGIPFEEIRERIMKLGLPYKTELKLSKDEVHYIAYEFGLDVPEFKSKEFLSRFVKRAPVVTVMGHVDHGKTTLLDTIRKTSVAEKEKGQITQAIGASTVKVDNDEIIFIDTPGHEAFTEMRLRGSIVTDIVILVVAADEGVKEQTIESLNHAKAAKVPIIVAINKMDKPGADPEKVKQQLADRGLLPEEWGGSTTYVSVSAKTGKGVHDLLEIIKLQAELLELRTNPNTIVSGTVIESEIDKSIGPLATVIVQTGVLKVGSFIRAGNVVGRIRFLTDTFGKRLNKAVAVSAVEVGGLSDIPNAGEIFYELNNPEEAKLETKKIEEARTVKTSQVAMPKTIEELLKEMETKEEKRLSIILKTDTQGSLEAVKHAITEIKSPVPLEIIHEGVGGIVKSDILLASASRGFILGFNVRPTSEAKQEAKQRGIEIKTYDIIFELNDELEKLLKGMEVKEKKELVIGKATVKQPFKVSGVGTIAGCIVNEGKIVRNARAKVIRDNTVIYTTEISSLKRFKEDVKEVAKGYECGIGLKNFNDIKTDDEIEVFVIPEEST